MAVNLAAKYSPVVDERFKLKSMTEAAVNQSYEWSGVDTVTVYDIPTVAMADYVRTGANRYGVPGELQNNKTSYQLLKDRGFTFTIDKGNAEETVGTMDAGKALARQQDEVIVPELDSYRLAAMVTAAIAAGGSPVAAVLSATTAYAAFLAMSEYFSNGKVPLANLISFVSPAFYTFIKLDNNFIKASELGQAMLINGQVGEVDGVKIVRVPSIYLPANVDFVGCHPSATVSPKKLEDYKVHDNPPGVSGSLVEGRIIYDAFVLTSKKKAVYCHKNL
jgi:N4-gp56 family major capsid protein